MRWLILFLFLFLIGCGYNTAIFTIKGTSMEPTLPPGTKVEVDFSYYHPFNDVMNGDVVVYKFQVRDSLFVKRVVAVPGDKIDIDTKRLKIGDRVIEGNFRILHKQMEHYKFIMPPKSYLVLGDGENSIDSKRFGLIPREYILGRVIDVIDKPTEAEQRWQKILGGRVVGELGVESEVQEEVVEGEPPVSEVKELG